MIKEGTYTKHLAQWILNTWKHFYDHLLQSTRHALRHSVSPNPICFLIFRASQIPKHEVEISVIGLARPKKTPHWKIQTKIRHCTAWPRLFAFGLSSLEPTHMSVVCVCVVVITLPTPTFLPSVLAPTQCFQAPNSAFSLISTTFQKQVTYIS